MNGRLLGGWLAAMLAGCGGGGAAAPPPAPLIAGPATGPAGVWMELSWQGPAAITGMAGAQLEVAGDSVFLLADRVLYRSDDQGAHFDARPNRWGMSRFAVFGATLLGWTENVYAPLSASYDSGATWQSRPVATHSGDHISSTGWPGSPKLLRVLGGVALMMGTERGPLQVSHSPPGGWRPTTFTPSPEYQAWARERNQAIDTEVADLAQVGDAFYACTRAGVFRSHDRGASWQQLPPPDGALSAYDSCWLAAFDSALCAAVTHTSVDDGLYCTADGETWQAVGQPEVAGFRRGHSAQAGGRLLLAVGGVLFEAAQAAGPWTRVTAVPGQVLAMVRTEQAVLVLTAEHGPDRIRLFRYRIG